jgi:hypothetical protein
MPYLSHVSININAISFSGRTNQRDNQNAVRRNLSGDQIADLLQAEDDAPHDPTPYVYPPNLQTPQAITLSRASTRGRRLASAAAGAPPNDISLEAGADQGGVRGASASQPVNRGPGTIEAGLNFGLGHGPSGSQGPSRGAGSTQGRGRGGSASQGAGRGAGTSLVGQNLGQARQPGTIEAGLNFGLGHGPSGSQGPSRGAGSTRRGGSASQGAGRAAGTSQVVQHLGLARGPGTIEAGINFSIGHGPSGSQGPSRGAGSTQGRGRGGSASQARVGSASQARGSGTSKGRGRVAKAVAGANATGRRRGRPPLTSKAPSGRYARPADWLDEPTVPGLRRPIIDSSDEEEGGADMEDDAEGANRGGMVEDEFEMEDEYFHF